MKDKQRNAGTGGHAGSWQRRALMALSASALLVCASSIGQPKSPMSDLGKDARVATVIADFRQTIPELMSRYKVPGCAVALVDREGVIWAEGFGHTSAKGKAPVTPDTPFFLGGMSKLLSATAVMAGVQDGVLALDRSVTNWLPEFKVYSRYEKDPEGRITLRRLLNQTAGLPVEAPLGNYFEPLADASFEEHVKSLYGNWLVYPVGQAFQVGNASSDLAAYILQVATGERFEDYIRKRLFEPLGMNQSTVDRSEIAAMKDRAAGHMMGIAKMPSTLPCLGAASIYSTAQDLGRFLRFQLNEGRVRERTVLDASWVKFLHAPVGIYEPGKVFYGAGVYIEIPGGSEPERDPNRSAEGRAAKGEDKSRFAATHLPYERTGPLFWSDGWGFGVCGYMHWYPEHGIGAVVLANRLPFPPLNDLCRSLTERLIDEGLTTGAANPQAGARPFAPQLLNTNQCIGTWWGWDEHQPTPFRPEWKRDCGTYRLRFNAYELEWWAKIAVFIKGREEFSPQITVQQHEGYLCVTESSFFDLIGIGRHKDEKLQAIAPGLFAAKSGIMLDFTQPIPRWRNYRMERK